MNILILILAGVVLLAACVTGLVLLILFLIKSLGGGSGSWRQLAATYATTKPPAGQAVHRATVQIGAVVYNRCVTLAVEDGGIYVAIGSKTALIPWADVTAVSQTTLHWQKTPLLTVGNPPLATMTIPPALLPALQSRLASRISATD